MSCDPEAVDETEWNLINEYFLDEQKPLKFNVYESGNVLIANESLFEEIVSTMEDNGVHEVKNLSEFEFYSRLKYLEKKFKSKADANRIQ